MSFLACLATASAVLAEACRLDRVDVRTDLGVAQFTVELADTPETRARGLMFREDLALNAGMLFIYDTTIITPPIIL